MKLTITFCKLLVLLLMAGNIFAQTEIDLAEAFMKASAKAEGISIEDVSDYKVSNSHTSNSNNVTHTYLQQQYNGIPIYNAVMGVHISKEGQLLKIDNQFLPAIEQKVNAIDPVLNPIEAIDAVVQQMEYDPTGIFSIVQFLGGTTQEVAISQSGIARRDIKAYLIYQPIGDKLHLSWNVNILEKEGQNWWNIRVDALTGEILDKTNWMLSCNFGHENEACKESAVCGHAHAVNPISDKKNPQNTSVPNSYNIYNYPVESPNHGSRSLVVNPADPIASPFGWHDTDGNAGAEFTITRGNNVWAQEDHDGNNGTGYSPDGGANLEFDYALDFNQEFCDSPFKDAAITNLFAWNNYMHDVWYQYGFDEASGNFQQNNYGNGGIGGDFVFADAQDGSGTNNATFGTPDDGGNPGMTMFLWNAGITTSAVNNFEVNSPGSIAGTYTFAGATFGATNFNLTGNIIIADDGTGSPTQACNPLTNAAAINGNIALIDRGGCEFGIKILNAQNAGAIAAIVCLVDGSTPFNMGPGDEGGSVTIPSIMISQADCATIRAQIPSVNATMQSQVTVTSCPTGNQAKDGDFDNGIVAHEYGHGISTRLTGGAGNSNCLNTSEQMGEGWSDWFGLMMTIEPGDTGPDGRGIGTFAIGQNTNGGGIRPFRYSTDLGINPHTYNDINSVSVPHGVGSVWCAMLWDLTWILIDEYGYDSDLYNGTGGNNIVMNLVTEGLKFQNCSPGFVDGRDGILAADQSIYGGQYSCLIWEAFAKRGLGEGASQGDPNDRGDGVESYDVPTSCTFEVDFIKTADKTQAAPGETITYTIRATNNSGTTLNNVVFTDPVPLNTTYVGASASNSGSETGGIVSWPGFTLNAGATATRTFSVQVDATLDISSPQISDDIESGNTLWTATASNAATGEWNIDSSNPNSGTSAWFAQDFDTSNEMYLTLTNAFAARCGNQLIFNHYFDTEVTWDGGRVQYSTDGTNWTTFAPSDFIQNPYNNIIDNDASQPGFSGLSGGTTATYIESIIDLSALAGQNIQIRFWMHCDQAVGGNGWFIDDIQITDGDCRIPNTAFMDSNENAEFDDAIDVPTLVIPGGTACTVNESYSGNILTGLYQVGNTITASGIVGTGSDVFFQANCIELNPGFEVALNADFLADINPCSPLVQNTTSLQEEGIIYYTQDSKGEFLNLDFNSQEIGQLQVELRSLNGKQTHSLLDTNIEKEGLQNQKINISTLEEGTYLLLSKLNGKEYIQKIVL